MAIDQDLSIQQDIVADRVAIQAHDNAPTHTEDIYLLLRNGELTQVTLDEMSPEERATFIEASPSSDLSPDPEEDPSKYLAYLKAHNPNYVYDDDFTPDMIESAVAWAKSRGFDPGELSPAQIRLSQDFDLGDKTRSEIAEDVKNQREARLLANKQELEGILAPIEAAFFHATPSIENVQSILRNGLYCDSAQGLNGSAAVLDSVASDADAETRAEVIVSNVRKLAYPHRGYRYELIIMLPKLSAEQKSDYRTRARQENVSATSYYMKKLAEEVGAQGVEMTYDAILPREYIRGYIDLDTGRFTSREDATA